MYTDGGDDRYGVEQGAGERPLQFRLSHVVISVPSELLDGVENFTLELQQDGGDPRRVAGVGARHFRRRAATTPAIAERRRQPPYLVDPALASRAHPVLRALLGRGLDRAEEEPAHDGVGDDHGGETEVGEEERDGALAAGRQPLTPLSPPLAPQFFQLHRVEALHHAPSEHIPGRNGRPAHQLTY